jgi:bacterial/archaeal transporter family-2 protein
MNLLLILATLGAGMGLAGGLAFNLRLARALSTPVAASMVNFWVGALTLFLLWGFGVDGARPTAMPPLWMLIGGFLGASYVTFAIIAAGRLGVGVSTVAVTFGQVGASLFITGFGWLGQSAQPPSVTGLLSALLLLLAVAVLARDRERAARQPK